MRLALDAIFAHPNVAPFVSKQLIQHLVTSNPPPAYVARVVGGVREQWQRRARRPEGGGPRHPDSTSRRAATRSPAPPTAGKLREPIMRLTGWARAFGASSPSGAWPIGDTSSSATRLGQSPGRSPSVFNFFRPGYTPPNSAIATAGLVAPEFQITNEPSVIAYVNYMAALIVSGVGRFPAPIIPTISALAGDSTGLVDEVDILLGAALERGDQGQHQRPRSTRSRPARPTPPLNRVYTAILLTLAAPEYLVQK